MSEEATHKGIGEKAKEAWDHTKETAHQAKVKTEQAIHDHPFESVGMAFAVGVVIGVLIGRR